jgi:cell division protein FtsQ
MQQVWRKRWRNTGWLALGAITLVLLAAGVHNKNNKACNGIDVVFSGEGNYFVDEKGVAAILKANGVIKGLPVDQINLRQLEERLKKDKWIANAELFFDNKQVLQAIIREKEPIARVFTAGGSSFYIDSACRRLPLSDKLSARIPMFTNFPSDRTTLSKPDSALLAEVKEVAMFIQGDEFWKAQVSQVDITPSGFEMIPTVGSHVVAFGHANDLQQKFDRLFSFYKQVWTKVGFERYEKIDVQYNGQVVATVKGAKASIVDTAKTKIAIENLIAKVKRDTDDSVVAVQKNAVKRDTVSKPVSVITKPVIPQQSKPVVQKKEAPKAAVAKVERNKAKPKTVLTAEEEAIRKEALKQQMVKEKKHGQVVAKAAQKRVANVKPVSKVNARKART